MKQKKTLPTQSSSSRSVDQNILSTNINQLDSSQSSKRKFYINQFFFFLYHAARIAFTIAIITVIATSNLNNLYSSETYERFQQTIQLWEKDVIIDIMAVNSYNCPESYEPMIGYQWPGITQGCACKQNHQDYQLYFIMKGECSQRAINYQCLKVNATNKVSFSFWIQHTKLLCVKRIPNLDFFTVDSPQYANKLTKICSFGTQYQFSIVNDYNLFNYGNDNQNKIKCPITQMSNKTYLNNNFSEVIQGQDTNASKKFSFLRESFYPIADFQISEYLFCPTYTKKNVSPNRTNNYPLQLESRTYCSDVQTQGSDPRIIQFDQQTQLSFFDRNPRVQQIISQLPGYPIPSNDFMYKLGYVRYPSWTYECRISSQFNLYKVKAHVQLQEQITTVTISTFLIIMFASLLGFIFTLGYILKQVWELRIKYKAGYLYTSQDDIMREKPNLLPQKSCQCQLIIFILQIIISLALLIVLIVYSVWINQQSQWYKQSINCLGYSETQRYSVLQRNALAKWIQTYRIDVADLLKSSLLSIVFLVIVVCLDVGRFIFRITLGDLHTKKLKVYADDQNQIESVKTEGDSQATNSNEDNSQQKSYLDKDLQNKLKKLKKRRNSKNRVSDSYGNLVNVTEQSFLDKQLEMATFNDNKSENFEQMNLNGFPRRMKYLDKNEQSQISD